MTEEQRRSTKRKRGHRRRGKSTAAVTNNESSSVAASSGSASPIRSRSKSSSSFLDKMKAKLSGGYFRMINEKLYTCRDARLAKSVKNKVFSFDLVSNDPLVIACDMSNTPLDSSSVDVAVFCLSLMGTNFPNYLQEANRVLKPNGWLLIAEVKSRFDPNTGGADPNKFVNAICELGFTSTSKDFSNKMFILFYFKKKEKQKSKDIEWPELKPCLYKRR
ncbi:UNVERIFIED_CONTAM: Ribosomal RNA-processing protein 8 [Sesamum latifolium]|uniref:Ribosomal RNA-processing protein 8 n=1 Tax=Sesamum latifolium TaxID=2727402 RepID=A0AAW2Y7Q6_9LAMI